MALETPLQENKKKGGPSKRAFRQMRERRREGIIKKASEYSKLCEADVCLGIRLRGSGRVYTFLADQSGIWSSFESHLEKYYPTPIRRTIENIPRSRNTQHGRQDSETAGDKIESTKTM
ncbi:MADS-box domain-containing protein [Aspergillus homomorphus CBS 101889]|uniref:MADS-box domain-containing protein n=1 Tax=Aspergillus homomorphus (strain CBS 101889) TaxID=1450537 RepID=A0A395HNV2_ASPHC|nr:hypothetical protein BO97DRAFT_169295 [Aspergillus homomorphus CBS 101889]RAL09440.1 hypothetical protein BO97DRAFT_169295 [Aspergillus homomorphus CBS 101889]